MYGLSASLSNNWSEYVQNFNSPSTVKQSALEWYPLKVRKSSIINWPLCDSEIASFTASSNWSTFSTFVTPLLPAESTGFTITGHVKYSTSFLASSIL